MVILNIFRWICKVLLIGLGLFFCSALVWNHFFVKPYDPFHGVPEDVDWGPKDRGMSYGDTIGQLGSTKYFLETVGSRRDSAQGPDWHYYGVSIMKEEEYPQRETISFPFFERWFDANEVSSKFLKMELNEIIQFDETTRTAFITVGTNQYTVILPPKDAREKGSE